MTPLVAGLLSLLAACSAAKLGDLPAAPAPAHAAAPAQRLPRRLPAFGDRLSALRRLGRPVFLPFPPGVRTTGNFSAPFLRLPPGVRAPGNFSRPFFRFPPGVKRPENVSLSMLTPFLRRPGNISFPLLALPPPPPGVVLPANFSTRVARHQLPFLVRSPGVVYATPPPHLLNKLKSRQQLAAAVSAVKPHPQSLGAVQPSVQSVIQSPIELPPPPPPPAASPQTPASTTLIASPPQPTARKPSFLDYFIAKGGKNDQITSLSSQETKNGIIKVPKLSGADFLRAVRRHLPAPNQLPPKARTLLPLTPIKDQSLPQSLTPPTREYLPPLATPSPEPPKDEYLPPPPPTPPKDEYLPPPPPTPQNDEYLPPPPPTPPKDEYLPPPPPPTPPQDEYLPPPPPPSPTPPKDEYLPPLPPNPPKDEYLPPPPTPTKTKKKAHVISDEVRKLISLHLIRALNQYLPPPTQDITPSKNEYPSPPPTPPKDEYLPPPPAPPKDEYLPPPPTPPKDEYLPPPPTPPKDEYLPPQPTPPKDEYLPPPPTPPKDEYLPPPPTPPKDEYLPPPPTPPKDEYLPPPPTPPKDEYLPPPPPAATAKPTTTPKDEYLPPPPPPSSEYLSPETTTTQEPVTPPKDDYLPPPPPPPSVEPTADRYLPPPASTERTVTPPESGYLPPAEEPPPPPPPPSTGYLPPPGGRFATRTASKTSGSSKRRKFKLSSDGVLRRMPDSFPNSGASESGAAESIDSGDPCDSLSCSHRERCQVILACAQGRRSCASTKRIAECVSRSHPTCHHCHKDEVCVLKKHCAYSETCPGAMQCMARSRNYYS